MITITNDINKAEFITHAGNFHADDVFSTAFLEKLYGNITLIRLKEYIDDGSKLAYDIGGGLYDHHQKDAKKRPNGLTYSGFGLLWNSFGLKYLEKLKLPNKEDIFKIFDDLLVTQIDAVDNGEFSIESSFNIYLIDDLIKLYRPNTNEEENTCFLEAVAFASELFDKILKDCLIKVETINKLKNNLNIQNRVLILKEFIPYEYAIFYLDIAKDIDFVIYPSNRGGYTTHTVPISYKSTISKIPLNAKWAGLRNSELQKVSQIKTAKFCHRNLFIANADTLEDALLFVENSK